MRTLWLLLVAFVLGGCATAARESQALPWRDDAFGTASVSLPTSTGLFVLDPELERRLRSQDTWRLRPNQRVDELLNLIFGADRKGFQYEAGHTTDAAETWRQHRGDCLSLTVLTYAAARALGLNAVIQEVQVPAAYDRRGNIDYVNHHVNLLVQMQGDRPIFWSGSHGSDVVIDFEPDLATDALGVPLTEQEVLARFYNNLGAQALARSDGAAAYRYFRAAASAVPGYAPTYTNLAVLYLEHGHAADAEAWLRHSAAISDRPEHPLRALHQLLLDEGRQADADIVAARLRSSRQNDPYYWIAQGVRHLADARPRDAIAALERARDMTSGFSEVHRYLALAYFQAGDAVHAQEQLALLKPADAIGAKLRRKFNSRTPP